MTHRFRQPKSYVLDAYKQGAENGRDGKGYLYVKAAGNEYIDLVPGEDIKEGFSYRKFYLGNSSMDGDNNSPYLILVGAINSNGVNASYSTPGPNLWISAPGGEFGNDKPAILTTTKMGCTDLKRKSKNTFNKGLHGNDECNYTATMNGTSSATPMVSGVVQEFFEQPNLKWYDVKYILAKTVDKTDPSMKAHLKNHPITKLCEEVFAKGRRL